MNRLGIKLSDKNIFYLKGHVFKLVYVEKSEWKNMFLSETLYFQT